VRVCCRHARARTHTHTHTHAAHSRRPGPGRAPARRSRGPARPPAPRFRRAAAARTPRTGSRRPRPAAKAYTFIDIDTSRGHQGGADRSRGREATCSMCVLNSKVRATSRSTRIAPHTCATRRRGHQPGGSLRLEHERPVPQSLTSIACDRSRLLSVKVSLSLSLSVSLCLSLTHTRTYLTLTQVSNASLCHHRGRAGGATSSSGTLARSVRATTPSTKPGIRAG